MPYCTNCGCRIPDNAKFCSNCGAAKNLSGNTQRDKKTIFEGNIYKCPSCGEVLQSFISNCPSCGYELRGNMAADSVSKLYYELNRADTSLQKDLIIRSFPIPNSKEDIFEFMIMASSNILGEDDRDIYEAWIAKFEQAYQKAFLLFRSDNDFVRIQQIYENCQANISTEKQRKINKFTVDTAVRNIAVCIGIILLVIAAIIERSYGNASLMQIAAYIVLIVSASSLVKRGATIIDYAVSAAGGLITIILSFFLYGSAGELCGAVVLIIVAANYFKSINKSKKQGD